ncbi:SEL1-like repeat protein [sulfur-oxidizing endosymbiont of Gigantopelta aegis]|uniref:SEL1-like repeat protein n=1 Tax=sulfur-oxidizing endosymbiont of Gigantopelta aegis TaxID=2794934 RepID=UPI001BE43986|nr:SEL1-like repeat protein [sulfur-oxidizing endosymbiont of Gigantopelta aegis]
MTLLSMLSSNLFATGPQINLTSHYVTAEEANQQGDRQTAFKEFTIAAHKRDARAYGKLGSMYLYGLGTPKDYHQAYIWFHMGYLTGERESERFRDAASSMMTRAEYLKAVTAAEQQRLKQQLDKAPPQQIPPVSQRK